MKFQSHTLLPALSKGTLKNLTSLVEERLAIPERESQKKFTAAEFHQITKQRRRFITRRFIG